MKALWRTCALLLLSCIVGCRGGTSAVPQRRPGPELRLALKSDIKSLDPAIAFNTVDCSFLRLTYEGLIDYGEGTDWVPWLAEEVPAIPADGKTYVFHLRKGIYFAATPGLFGDHDREVTAEDFVYSLERVLDPKVKSPGGDFFGGIVGFKNFQDARSEETKIAGTDEKRLKSRWIEPVHAAGIKALDRYTLQIELEEADPSFLHLMTMGFAYAVPREAVEKYGDRFALQPVGTGPYRMTEWSRDRRIRYERRTDYHSPTGPSPPVVDAMIGGDAFTQQMMFERGEVDFLLQVPPPDVVRLTSQAPWKECLRRCEGVDVNYLGFNCEMEPFTDVRVRQAMCYAIDKNRILKALNRMGIRAKSYLPPQMPGYNEELKELFPYDPERARQLLKEAGLENGFTFELRVGVKWPERVKMAQQIQQDLAPLGITVRILEISGNAFEDAVCKRKESQACIYGWSQDYPDPSDFLDVLFNGKRITKENCNNTAFYNNEEVNKLLKEAREETRDPKKRLKMYQEIEKKILADAPWLPLYHSVDYRQCQPWLKGYQPHPVYWVRYEKLWIEQP